MFYFDNAATTFPKPVCVLEAVNQGLTSYGGNPGRAGHDMAMKVSQKIYDTRCKVAEFFGGEAENVAFTSSCTMSLNMAIKGVLSKNDHAICSCLEHNSVVRPLHKLSKFGLISYDLAKVYDTDFDTVESFRRLIKPNTKAIICTHASNVTGKILPIKEIGKLCKEYGIYFIVDAAQSAGVLPIDMEEFNINILCMAGHKGLYGTTGSGVLIIRGLEEIRTLIEGGTGSVSVGLDQPDFLPDRFEAGTPNTLGILSIGAGIDFINRNGLEKIYSHEFKICQKVYDQLSQIENITLYAKDFALGKYAPIVAFNVNDLNSDILVAHLNENDCALRGGLHCSPTAHEFYGTLDTGIARFSPSFFTKDIEVNAFLKIFLKNNKKVFKIT